MLVEGKGCIAPKPVRIALTHEDVFYVRQVANERARYRQYHRSRGMWKRGLTTDPIFAGTLGELAVVKWVNRAFGNVTQLDDKLRLGGDGGKDVDLFGYKLEVKSETKQRDESFLRRINDRGNLIPLTADAYVFVCVDDHEAPLIHGWIPRDAVRSASDRRRAWRGKHHNLQFSKRDLEPMCRLRLLLAERRAS